MKDIVIRSRWNAFTLVESLAVMSIMCMLMGITIGIGRYAIFVSKRSKMKADLAGIDNAIVEYMIQYGKCPPSGEGCLDATELQDGLRQWLPEEISLIDPQGQPYQYQGFETHWQIGNGSVTD